MAEDVTRVAYIQKIVISCSGKIKCSVTSCEDADKKKCIKTIWMYAVLQCVRAVTK